MNNERIFNAEKFSNTTDISELIKKINIGESIGGYIEAGQTYFGQLIAHDIVPSTELFDSRKDISPKLLLNSIYGDGNGVAYFENEKFKLGKSSNNNEATDLYRKNEVAQIPEPRNDENIIVSQLHLLWQKFHNSVINYLKREHQNVKNKKELAKKIVITIFHKITVSDYLLKILHPKIFDLYLRKNDNFFFFYGKYHELKKIPVEFSMAAFRFGHSMVRSSYKLNNAPPFTLVNLLKKDKILEDNLIIEWRRFFRVDTTFIGTCSNKTSFISLLQSILNKIEFNKLRVKLLEGKIPVQAAKMIMPNIVNDMTKLPILCKTSNELCQDIRARNISTTLSSKIPSANMILDVLYQQIKFKELFDIEIKAYCDIANKTNSEILINFLLNNESLLNSFIYNQSLDFENIEISELIQSIENNNCLDFDSLSKNFNEMDLWTFILHEAESSRIIYNENHREGACYGLGLVGSILIAEVLLQSINLAKIELNINDNERDIIEDFIKAEISGEKKITMANVIKYVELEKNYGK